MGQLVLTQPLTPLAPQPSATTFTQSRIASGRPGLDIPLHRQERIFRREGVHLPRSTLCGFVQGSASL
ncbi:MAG: transposase [Myxococcota bacterium]